MSESAPLDWDFLEAQFGESKAEIPNWAFKFPPDSRIRGMIVEQHSLTKEDPIEPARVFLKSAAELKLTLLYNFDIYVDTIMLQEDNPKIAIERTQASLKDETVLDLSTDGEDLISLVEGYIKEISDAYAELPAMNR